MGIIKTKKKDNLIITSSSSTSFDTYNCTYLGKGRYTNFPDRSYILKLRDLPSSDIKDRIGNYHTIGIELSFTLPSEEAIDDYLENNSDISILPTRPLNIFEYKNLFNFVYKRKSETTWCFGYWSYFDSEYKNITEYPKNSVKREFKLVMTAHGIDFASGTLDLSTIDGEVVASMSGALKFHNYYHITDNDYMSFGTDCNSQGDRPVTLTSTWLDGIVDLRNFKITDNDTGEVLVQTKHLS